mgnify:FL=1
MISFDEFIKKWKDKKIDWDGIYPNQCMDLSHFYAYECLGITDKAVLATPSAYQVYTQFKWPEYFTKIENTPTNVPNRGDIVIFGQSVGQWGHICVFVEGDVNSFKSFDSNWPTGTLPHIQDHTYDGVLGWLRHNSTDYKKKYEDLCISYGKLQVIIETQKKQLEEVEDKYAEEIRVKTEMVESLQKSLSELTSQLINTSKTLKDTQDQVKSLTEAYGGLEGHIIEIELKNKQEMEIFERNMQNYIKLNEKLTSELKIANEKLEEGLSKYTILELIKAILKR